MLGVSIALIVVGLILVLALPWFGIPLAVVGLVLLVLSLAGFGRRGAARQV